MSVVTEQKKKDRKDWTIVEKTEPQLKKGFSVDLKSSNQYQIILVRKKEVIFSF
ncbi:MAG: hypothetical protein ACI843_001628 [Psychrobacter glaciei]